MPKPSLGNWSKRARRCIESARSRADNAAARCAAGRAAGARTRTGPRSIMRDPRRVAVLISGRGSNMRALVEQANGYEVVLVASNKPEAPGLDYARSAGIP